MPTEGAFAQGLFFFFPHHFHCCAKPRAFAIAYERDVDFAKCDRCINSHSMSCESVFSISFKTGNCHGMHHVFFFFL